MEGIYEVIKDDIPGDDAPAIRAALNKAKEKRGGVVWLPPGEYQIDSEIVIDQPVTLKGAGWSTDRSVGTWLYVQDFGIKPFSVEAAGVVISDIGIAHDQRPALEHARSPEKPDRVPLKEEDKWEPYPYKFAISIYKDDVKIQNVCLLNPTKGILIEDCGRVTLDGIWGEPLEEGIRIVHQGNTDAHRINNVHFWTFWSDKSEISIKTHKFGAANGIISYRSDNPFFSNIFMIGYHYGFYFRNEDNDKRRTNKFHIANADIDLCYADVVIDGNHTSGQIVNFTGSGTIESNVGIWVEAEDVLLQCSNIRLTTYANNCIRVGGQGTIVYLDNVVCEDWNNRGAGTPAIETLRGAIISIGANYLEREMK